jgi:hypothetical protein
VLEYILRTIHLIFSIPMLGYIYGQASEVQQYAAVVRVFFVPVIVLSGYWTYSGVFFAIIGFALWRGAYCLSGYGAGVLTESGRAVPHTKNLSPLESRFSGDAAIQQRSHQREGIQYGRRYDRSLEKLLPVGA